MTRLRPLLVAAVVGFATCGVPGLVGGVGLVGIGPLVCRRRRRSKADGQLVAQLAAVMELAARSVRSGQATGAALGDAASRVGGVAGPLVDDLLGVASTSTLSEAVTAWSDVHESDSVAVVSAAIGLVADGEASGARAFEAAAAVLRARDAAARELVAWSSQARASATLLVVAPAVFGAASLMFDPTTAAHLVASPLGAGSIATGLLLELAGAAWMTRLVSSVGGG